MNETKTIILSHGEWQEERTVNSGIKTIDVFLSDHENPDPYNPNQVNTRTVTLCPTGKFNDIGLEIWRMAPPKKINVGINTHGP